MPEDPYDKARRDMERAHREFHGRMEQHRAALEQAIEQARTRMAQERDKFEGRMEEARRCIDAARKKPPRPFGGSGKRKDPRPGGPQPTPVRPNNPNILSGGAEAPLDE